VARSTGKAGLAVVEKGKEINTQYGVADKVCDKHAFTPVS